MRDVTDKQPITGSIKPEKSAPVRDFIDSVIYALSPRRGANRYATRAAFEAANRRRIQNESNWDAAQTSRKRNWLGSKLGINQALEEDLAILRERSREESERDPIAAGAVASAESNIIGTGLTPQSRIVETPGLITKEQATRYVKELEGVYKQWAKSAGVDGSSFAEVQRNILRSWLVDGDGFAVLTGVSDATRPIPLAVQLIDAAAVENPLGPTAPPVKDSAGNVTRMGVKTDKRGKPLGYWVRQDMDTPYQTFSHKFVEADSVCHVFDRIRIGQVRGVPWLAPVLASLKDCKDYREAELIGRQVAACYSVFVTTPQDAGQMALLASTGIPAPGTTPQKMLQEIEPGRIDYLQPGQGVEFANPGRDEAFVGFMEGEYRCIAAGLNFPYELLVKDYSKTNYLSGRLSLMDGRLGFRVRQKTLDEKFLYFIWRELVSQAIAVGACSIPAKQFQENPEPFLAHAWIAQGWAWIDPDKEVTAARSAIDANLSTLSDELAAMGRDTQEVLQTKRRDLDLMEELEIPYICAPGSASPTDGTITTEGATDPNADPSLQGAANAGQ